MPVLLEYLRSLQVEDLVIVSPDAGRVKVAERYTNLLHADLAIVHKRRHDAQERGVGQGDRRRRPGAARASSSTT